MRTLKNGWKKYRIKIVVITGVTSLLLMFYSFANNDFKIVKYLDIYYTLFRELNLYYVDETDPEKLVKTSIDAMLESLDPYTVFIPESEMDDFKFMTTGQYGGIGAMIRKDGNSIIISELLENYPAHHAGIKPGDVIVEINGVSVYGKNTSEISELLKGEPKSQISMTLLRPGDAKPYKKELTREKISLSNVPYYGLVQNNLGYIKLSNFTAGAHLEVKTALMQLKEKGAKGIILDLRNNPGGLLVEAVDIANLFLDKGQEVVKTKGKVKQWDNTYKTKTNPVFKDIPLTVLVNKNSASASEIVAGSLQDLDRAVIIGQKTFGKGLVQSTRQLSYNTQLKVTTAKYYIPSGRCIQALDYSNRDADGSINNVPDSLVKEFTTRNGRKVYDAGGILPDIAVKKEILSRVVLNLYSRNYIFNFVNEYVMKKDSMEVPSKFVFTERDYTSFLNYLKEKGFDYQTETEDAFQKLKNIAIKENYWELSKSEFNTLEEKIKHDKLVDLEKNKEEIVSLLKEEIASRYYYQKGRIEISLFNDPYVKEAADVLSNDDLYSSILNGTASPRRSSKVRETASMKN
jgi:carboxyl-terminal processing protease